MPVISIFGGIYCLREEVINRLLDETRYSLFTDQDLVRLAGQLSGVPAAKITKAFSAKTSVFNSFTQEKERSVAYLKYALAQTLAQQPDAVVVAGFCTHLIPSRISHVLHVCLIADLGERVLRAVARDGMSEKEAMKKITHMDEDSAAWVASLRNSADPWDARLYDILIPTDKTSMVITASLIGESLERPAVQPTAQSQTAVDDFLVAARTEQALAQEGHLVQVECDAGRVTLTINKHVLMLGRLEDELKAIAGPLEGVRSVTTRVGPDFYKTDIYRKADFETPSRVLLVDDEREFVQTLSERLQMRDVGSAVAYDGESALKMVENDEPDVMILDLKMPGIDGIEVLRRVKKSNPHIEVIILTGHGSDEDCATCMKMGAFAYLQKPVDIDALSDTLRRANDKARLTAHSADKGDE